MNPKVLQFHHGEYRILRLLGQGGFGVVYLVARSGRDSGEHFAAKLLRTDYNVSIGGEILDRFVAEMYNPRLLNISIAPRIYDTRLEPQPPGFVMEYLPSSLLEWRRSTSREQDIEEMARCILRCVASLHERGVVHRDIKFENFLLRQDGTLVVTDFGIAHWGPNLSLSMSVSRGKMIYPVGSLFWMPPEVLSALAMEGWKRIRGINWKAVDACGADLARLPGAGYKVLLLARVLHDVFSSGQMLLLLWDERLLSLYPQRLHELLALVYGNPAQYRDQILHNKNVPKRWRQLLWGMLAPSPAERVDWLLPRVLQYLGESPSRGTLEMTKIADIPGLEQRRFQCDRCEEVVDLRELEGAGIRYCSACGAKVWHQLRIYSFGDLQVDAKNVKIERVQHNHGVGLWVPADVDTEFVVGRGSGSHIRVDDRSVSRQHLKLRFTDKGLQVQNLRPRNPTRIYDLPLPPNAQVVVGTAAQIGVGLSVLVYRMTTESPSADQRRTRERRLNTVTMLYT